MVEKDPLSLDRGWEPDTSTAPDTEQAPYPIAALKAASDIGAVDIDDIRSWDLLPGSGFEVEIVDGWFHVSLFNDWAKRGKGPDGVGESVGLTAAVALAIEDSVGLPAPTPLATEDGS